jgi:predicted amidophosphoribosyltransferase
MTSTILLLPTESQADLDALLAQWHLQYPTANDIAQRLVTRAALSEWHPLRLERQFNTASSQLLAIPITDWTGDNHKLYQNVQRYLTTAQRAHHRQ